MNGNINLAALYCLALILSTLFTVTATAPGQLDARQYTSSAHYPTQAPYPYHSPSSLEPA